MGYLLAVDLGTTYTAAAVRTNGRAEVVQLGTQRPEIPSLVFVKPDGGVLVGEAAERRGEMEPTRLAREFKRRLGDQVPLRIGGSSFSAHALMARLLSGVLETVAGQQEGEPDRICLTCPANWGPYKRDLMNQVVQLAGLDDNEIRTEPEAAAVRYAANDRVEPGETVAVYDLGGGTFDAAVLRKVDSGFELLGEPFGIEQLGGMDFDQAVFEHVIGVLGSPVMDLDQQDPAVLEGLNRLRRDCMRAKETLSYDTEIAIPVALPSLHTRVRLVRSEFEAMIEPALADTLVIFDLALRSAKIPTEFPTIDLAGRRIDPDPRITDLLTARYRRPLVMDSHPEHSIALGAALAARYPERPIEGAPPGAAMTNLAVTPPPRPPVPVDREQAAPAEDTTVTHLHRRPRWVIAVASVMILLLAIGVVWALVNRKPQDQIAAPGPASPTVTRAAWVRQADLPVALEGAAVAAYQDKVWVAGGLSTDAARTKLSTVFIFDPRTNTWISGPALPRPISHGSLVPTPWTLYFIAGWVQDGGSAQVLKLNATNTAWVEDVPLPEKRVAGAAAYDGSTVIYAGGTQKGGAPTDTVWALRGGRWQDIGRLRHKRQKLAAVSNSVDTVWVLGGRNHLTDTKYGDMDRIAQGRVMPLPASRAAPISPPVDSAAAVQLEGYGVCLVGGEIGDRRYNDWWCEQPTADLPKLSPQRAGLGVAKIGETIYVVGGYGATFQGTNRVEALTPPRP